MKTVTSFRDLLGFLLLILVMTPVPASSQYAFLDLTGDSLNTGADVLGGSLPVNVDVYLVTNRNRDGSPVACGSGSEPLTLDSFEFAPRGGTYCGVRSPAVRSAEPLARSTTQPTSMSETSRTSPFAGLPERSTSEGLWSRPWAARLS